MTPAIIQVRETDTTSVKGIQSQQELQRAVVCRHLGQILETESRNFFLLLFVFAYLEPHVTSRNG